MGAPACNDHILIRTGRLPRRSTSGAWRRASGQCRLGRPQRQRRGDMPLAYMGGEGIQRSMPGIPTLPSHLPHAASRACHGMGSSALPDASHSPSLRLAPLPGRHTPKGTYGDRHIRHGNRPSCCRPRAGAGAGHGGFPRLSPILSSPPSTASGVDCNACGRTTEEVWGMTRRSSLPMRPWEMAPSALPQMPANEMRFADRLPGAIH
jgi:hypothetical protein